MNEKAFSTCNDGILDLMNMESVGDSRSTIDKEIAAFDHEPETALTELTIRELISTYPDNQDVRHVLVKVNLIRLKKISREISEVNGQFDEGQTEKLLGFICTPDRLASMVLNRYSQLPVVDLY